MRARFDGWQQDALERLSAALTFPEIRKGAQAISSLYLERRATRGFERALTGAGKRAAFACYYAPLHFLAAHHALAGIRAATPGWPDETARVIDLGCGTGAVGAAVGFALGGALPLRAMDRSGWALGEARHTLRAFGLVGHTVRGALPAGLPAARRGDLLTLGWVLNELPEKQRDACLTRLEALTRDGVQVLILEPLAGPVVPWWDACRDQLAGVGMREQTLRQRIILPGFVAKLDRATGLDHRELGARVLYGPA